MEYIPPTALLARTSRTTSMDVAEMSPRIFSRTSSHQVGHHSDADENLRTMMRAFVMLFFFARAGAFNPLALLHSHKVASLCVAPRIVAPALLDLPSDFPDFAERFAKWKGMLSKTGQTEKVRADDEAALDEAFAAGYAAAHQAMFADAQRSDLSDEAVASRAAEHAAFAQRCSFFESTDEAVASRAADHSAAADRASFFASTDEAIASRVAVSSARVSRELFFDSTDETVADQLAEQTALDDRDSFFESTDETVTNQLAEQTALDDRDTFFGSTDDAVAEDLAEQTAVNDRDSFFGSTDDAVARWMASQRASDAEQDEREEFFAPVQEAEAMQEHLETQELMSEREDFFA